VPCERVAGRMRGAENANVECSWRGMQDMAAHPMRAKRPYWPLVLLLAIAAPLVWVLACRLARPRCDAGLYVRVKPWMTEQEVVRLLGGPAHSTTSPIRMPPRHYHPGQPNYWSADAGVIEVWLDDQGKVLSKRFFSWDFDGGRWPRTLRQFGL
jgi:hypothetical protein